MRTIMLFMALSLLLPCATPARAHALLDHADPRVGSSVHPAPRTVSLWFTQNLEPAFSTIEVSNAAGIRVDQGKAFVDRSDPALLHVALKSLLPGTYRVKWKVLSVDTHTTEGSFTFQVDAQ